MAAREWPRVGAPSGGRRGCDHDHACRRSLASSQRCRAKRGIPHWSLIAPCPRGLANAINALTATRCGEPSWSDRGAGPASPLDSWGAINSRGPIAAANGGARAALLWLRACDESIDGPVPVHAWEKRLRSRQIHHRRMPLDVRRDFHLFGSTQPRELNSIPMRVCTVESKNCAACRRASMWRRTRSSSVLAKRVK